MIFSLFLHKIKSPLRFAFASLIWQGRTWNAHCETRITKYLSLFTNANFPVERQDHLLRSSVYFGNFPVERSQQCVFRISGSFPWMEMYPLCLPFKKSCFPEKNFHSGRQNQSLHLHSIRNFRICWVNGQWTIQLKTLWRFRAPFTHSKQDCESEFL